MKREYISPRTTVVDVCGNHMLCLSMTENTGKPGGTTPPEQEGGAFGAPAFGGEAPWSEESEE